MEEKKFVKWYTIISIGVTFLFGLFGMLGVVYPNALQGLLLTDKNFPCEFNTQRFWSFFFLMNGGLFFQKAIESAIRVFSFRFGGNIKNVGS